ncbi:MAG: hypothetical protein WC069_05895 [Candidatus Shapirobacteria bacterium]
MKSNLSEMMGKLDSKYQEFSDQQAGSATELSQVKSENLQKLFDIFQSYGVDPSDPQAVRNLLDKVKQNNPEAYTQVEQALTSLMGPEEGVADPMNEVQPETPAEDMGATTA